MIGRSVTHYRIVEKLGEGGMGVVYRGEDTRLKRPVAIKFLPDELASDREALERFVREARAASALNHPNICTVHELGEMDGRPFLVMELLEGKTLRQHTAGRRLETGEILDLAVQLCRGLEAVHAQGIIHRDIKPANIFITRSGQAKLVDFGIAKLARRALNPGAHTEALLTQSGMAIGTLGYLSPEQARGEEVDARTDLFSFGVVMHELITGAWPFAGATPVEALAAVVDKTPFPPLPLRPDLPPELGRIVARLLEKDREARYGSAAELRSDLLRLRRDVPAGAEPRAPADSIPPAAAVPVPRKLATSASLRFAGRWRRRRLWAAIGCAVILLAAGVFLWRRAPPRPLTERDWIVLADFENHTGDASFDGALRQALSVHLSQSPHLNVVGEARVEAALRRMGKPAPERLTRPVAREVCEREGVKALLAGSIAAVGRRYTIGLQASDCRTGEILAQEQAEARDKDRVLTSLGQASSRIRRKLGESLASVRRLDIPIAEATTPSLEALKAYSLGWELHRKGGSRDAIPFYRRAIELDPGFALAYRALGAAHNNASEWELARQFRSMAFELRQRATERERLLIQADYFFGFQRDQEKAAEVFQIYSRMYPRDPVAHVNLGVIYGNQGRHEQAVASYRAALQVADRPSPAYYTNLAAAYCRLNRFAEAREQLRQALTKFDTGNIHGALYVLAHIEGDAAEMERRAQWFNGRPEEYAMAAAQAAAAAFEGRLGQSRKLWKRAHEIAGRAGLKELRASYLAVQALQEALAGNDSMARDTAARSLLLAHTRSATPALALALAGSAVPARESIGELEKRYPQDTILHKAEIPCVRGALELLAGNPASARELLEGAAYELGSASHPVLYLRGQAHLRAGEADEAARDFQRIIDHRGLFTEILYPLAHLGKGRARAQAGRVADARQAYDAFFQLWANAGPDVPVLEEARREYAKLR